MRGPLSRVSRWNDGELTEQHQFAGAGRAEREKQLRAHSCGRVARKPEVETRLAGFFGFQNVTALVGAAFCAGTMGQLLGVTVRAL
jgi:hypothetical protein